MIFDCHTHLFGPGQVGGPTFDALNRIWGNGKQLIATPEDHWKRYEDADGAIVLAVDAPATGIVVPNEYVAEYVSKHSDKLFGFASVDPNKPDAGRLLEHAIREYRLSGLKLGPIYQNFYPGDKKHETLYAKADELNIPILWHQGTSYVPEGFLDASRPADLDPISRAFPNLKMIIAHMGHPWIEECICIVRKNKNMYMDLSTLMARPWQFYNAMVLAMEYGVLDKILFGTDFPLFTVQQTIDSLRNVNSIAEGTGLPRIPEKAIEGIIHRNTVELLELH